MKTSSTLHYHLIVWLGLLLSLPSLAQNQPLDCGTDQFTAQRLATDSTYRRFYNSLRPNQNKGGVDTTTVFTIPVVFVVYHLGEAVGTGSNVSEAALQGQIDLLNRTFAGQRPDYAGVDTKIRFALAQRTPSCTPFNGVARVDARSVPGYEATGLGLNDSQMSDQLRKLLPEYAGYINDRYVVVRVVHRVYGGAGGWAAFGGNIFVPAGEMLNPSIYNSLLTHEMGHSLFLAHTFTGSDFINGQYICPSNDNPDYEGDLVADTDPHKKLEPDNACNPASENLINSCTGRPFGLIGRNHMSYGCNTILFTRGQMIKMRSYFTENSRGLLNSPYLNPPQAGEAVVAACVPTVMHPVGTTDEGLKSFYFQQINRQNEFGIPLTGHYLDHSCTERATVTAGQSYSLSVVGQGRFRRVYIDYNNDGSFDEGTERVLTDETSSDWGQVSSGQISIPTNAVMGPYLRMRVIVNGGSVAPTACNLPSGQYSYGEVHDYGVRVLPATTPASLSLGTLASAYFCRNQQLTIPIATEGAFDAGNVFTVQLSDATGSFQNPIAIGSSSGSPVPVQLPLSVALGDDYRMRVVSSSPALTSLPGPTLTLEDLPTATISGSQTLTTGQTATLTITLTGRPHWYVNINRGGQNLFQVWGASTSPAALTFVPQSTDVYTLAYVQNVCGNGTVSGSVTITVPCTAPTSLSESVVSANAVQLYWDIVWDSSPGGPRVSYEIQWKEATAADWNLVQNLTQNQSQYGYPLGGLDPTKLYQWRIRKVCPDGPSDWSPNRLFQTQCTVPQPGSFTNLAGPNVRVSWTGGPTGLPGQVRWRVSGFTNWTVGDISTTPDTYLISGLNYYTTYEWQVRTFCTANQLSDYSATATFNTYCAPPTSIYVTSNNSTSAQLYWNSQSSTTVDLRWRAVGNTTWNIVPTPTASPYNLTGLTSGTTYEWQVQSVCSGGATSGFTNSLTFTAQCPVPTSMGESVITASFATVQWSVNQTTIQASIRWRVVGSPTWQSSTTLSPSSGTGFSYTLTGLTAGQTHEWQVVTYCPDGSSTPSASRTFVAQCPVPTPNYSFNDADAVVVYYTFKPSVVYQVHWRPQGSTTWTESTTIASTSYRVTGLVIGTPYEWQVRAICPDGSISDYSSSLTIVATCPIPGSIFAQNIRPGSARLSWYNNVSATELRWRPTNSATWTTVPVSGTNVFVLTGLTNGITYECQVRAVCSGSALSAYSSSSFFTTSCRVPTYFYESYVLASSALVNWSSESDMQYVVEWRQQGTATWQQSGTPTSGNSYTLTGLTTGATYEWRVLTDCDGVLTPSASRTFTTQCVQLLANSMNYSNVTSGAAGLNWFAPSGLPGLAYRVRWRPVGTTSWTESTTLTGTAYSVTGLTNNTVYEWQAQSICDGVGGPYVTATSTFTTNCAASVAYAPPPGDTWVQLNWTTIFGERYNLEYRVATDPTWTSINSLTTSTYQLTTMPGTAYEYRIRTACSDGSTGPVSNVVAFTTLPACDPNEPNDSSMAATSIPGTSFTSVALCIGRPGDQDWFRWQHNGYEYYVAMTQASYTGPYQLSLDLAGNTLTIKMYSVNGLYPYTQLQLVAADGITNVAYGTSGSSSVIRQIVYTLPPVCSVMATTKNGNWADPSVWSCGRTPIPTDSVQVLHTVTMPYSGTARALRVTYGTVGKLIMNTGTRLMMGQ